MLNERQITDLLDALESDIKALTRTRDTDTAAGRAVMESYALGHLAVLRHALATTPAPADKWLPIETAPRDGTYILLLGDSGYTTTPHRVAVGCWIEGFRDYWLTHSNDAFMNDGPEPTHWMPLPPAPADSVGEPKCVKCGHHNVDREGVCKAEQPHSKNLYGRYPTRYCGCKCEFPVSQSDALLVEEK